MKELERSYLRKETKEKIRQIKLFKFTDESFFSINDIIKRKPLIPSTTNSIPNINNFPDTSSFSETDNFQVTNSYPDTNSFFDVNDLLDIDYFPKFDNLINPNKHPTTNYYFVYNSNKYFFNIPKTEGIINELKKIGIILSEINISDYPNIFSSVEKMPDEKQIYTCIAEACKTNKLTAEEKKKLFLNFLNKKTRFNNVDDSLLKDLYLFCNNNSRIKPLNKLIGNIKIPSWLNVYKIKQDEYFFELDSCLITESEDVFKKVYQQNQNEILVNLTSAEEIKSLINFYQDNQKSFFKNFIIKKNASSFIIVDKTNETFQVHSIDKETRKFIDAN
jgi:hypothetical protein